MEKPLGQIAAFLFFLDSTTCPPTSVRLVRNQVMKRQESSELGPRFCSGQVGGQVFPLIRNDKFSPGPLPGDTSVPGLTGQRRLSWAKEGGRAELAARRGWSEGASLQFIAASLVCQSRKNSVHVQWVLLGKTAQWLKQSSCKAIKFSFGFVILFFFFCSVLLSVVFHVLLFTASIEKLLAEEAVGKPNTHRRIPANRSFWVTVQAARWIRKESISYLSNVFS